MTFHLRARVQRGSGFLLDLDINIADRQVTALYGPSGAGKTTLLKLLAGIADISKKDEVHLHFRDQTWHHQSGRKRQTFVPPHQRNIGYVFQDLQLFPHLSVAGNLQFASRRRPAGKQPLDETHLLELLEIRHLIDAPVEQLSGGERQRVAIARALFTNPQLLLLDEPLGAIDALARTSILAYLKQLQQGLQLPMVYVSHAREEVTYLADQVHVIRAGALARAMTRADFANDLSESAGEASLAAIITCRVTAQDDFFALTTTDFEGHALYLNAGQYQPGDELSVSVPARDLSLVRSKPADTSILNLIPATITDLHDPGSGTSALARLKVGSQHLLARITRKSLAAMNLSKGDAVFAQIKGVALSTELASKPSTSEADPQQAPEGKAK